MLGRQVESKWRTRVVVLNLGRVVYDGPVQHMDAEQLWALMAGGAVAAS